MGDVVRRGTKDRPRFYIRYVDVDGQRKQRAVRGATTLSDARRVLAATELRVTNGKVGIEELTEAEQDQRAITIRELFDRFMLEYAPPKVKDIEEYRSQTKSVFTARVLPTLGSRTAASITSLDVEKLRDQLLAPADERDGYAPGSVAWTMARLSKLYVWGRKVGALSCQSPVAGVEAPSSQPTIDYLSKQEVGVLLPYLEERPEELAGREVPQLHTMVAAAIYAGLRKGELMGLRWIDLNLERLQLTVAKSYTGTPKSGKARHIPIHPELARVLRAWQKRCPATAQGLVFPILDVCEGWTMGQRRHMLHLKHYLKASGCHVPEQRAWHFLRHTFASHFMMAGGNILTLQKLLGHADLATTLIYAHLAPDFMAAEVARMSFAISTADVTDLGEARRERAAAGHPADTSSHAEEVTA